MNEMNEPEMNEMKNQKSSLQKNLSNREILHKTALNAPHQSGVYLWRNQNQTVIYVGKAKNLHNRLCSYFSGQKDIKTNMLISHATSIEYITTNNEYEAFLLENNLIKKYTPRYNINLKDGKSYPVLRITNEKFPRIFKTRTIIQDGSSYFGPFPDASALDTFLETLYEIYPLRHCKTLKKRISPCMYYHIGKCKAPCCQKIEESAYNEFIEEISELLENKGKDTVQKIESEMKKAASNLNFEKAARLRDGLKALSVLQNQNIVENFDDDECDYIASWREGELVSFTVLKMRQGKLLGRDNYRTVSLNEDYDLLEEFMSAYYTERDLIPSRIYISSELAVLNFTDFDFGDDAGADFSASFAGASVGGAEATASFASKLATDEKKYALKVADSAGASVGNAGISESDADVSEGFAGASESDAKETAISASARKNPQIKEKSAKSSDGETENIVRYLSEEFSVKTKIIPVNEKIPQAKLHLAAINMARQNAHEDIIRRLRDRGDFPAMEELQKVLSLPKLPVRIEGFDIAHIGGKFPVASLISFYNGNPDKKNYRYFRLKTTDGIIDDFQSMREATTRRYTRLLNEGKELPDLLLIDGGIGQVNAVQGVLDALEIEIPIAGLAKRDEEIWRPHASKPICLPKRSDALRLLQRVRDETHRFATSRNQNLRTKENTISPFIKLPHIGVQKDKILMKKYGSLENLCAASESEIAQTVSVNALAASDILIKARELLKIQNQTKEKEMKSLDYAGTTKEIAARKKENANLALSALNDLE